MKFHNFLFSAILSAPLVKYSETRDDGTRTGPSCISGSAKLTSTRGQSGENMAPFKLVLFMCSFKLLLLAVRRLGAIEDFTGKMSDYHDEGRAYTHSLRIPPK